MTNHVAVWIDHKEAHVYHLDPEKMDGETVQAPAHHIHNRHPKGPEGAKNHPNDAKHFFHEVVGALGGSDPVLIVGPASAKLDFFRYLHKHDHVLEARIVGIETVDHPTDRQLIAYAKAYFQRTDKIV